MGERDPIGEAERLEAEAMGLMFGPRKTSLLRAAARWRRIARKMRRAEAGGVGSGDGDKDGRTTSGAKRGRPMQAVSLYAELIRRTASA